MRGILFSSALFFRSVQCHVVQIPLNGESTQVSNLVVDWKSLNTTVGGKLYSNAPYASPCYPEDGGYGPRDKSTCKARVEKKRVAFNVSDTPSGYYFSNWASCQETGDSCALPLDVNMTVAATAKCSQGNLPDYYIEVKDETDITAALRFGREKKIPIVVKNSGHDWKGRSAAPGALALWTHNYRDKPVLKQNFVAEGCNTSVTHAITFSAGWTWLDILRFANSSGLVVLGGTCPDVGPMGWIAGGGHSPLSPTYGLGVDNVQQISLVLPNGTIANASRCHNSDLFFALTGGGPNTWGIITSMTYQAHPILPIQEFTLNYTGIDVQNMRKFFQIVTSNANNWTNSGWGGYIRPGIKGRFFTLIKPLNGTTAKQAEEEMKPLIEFATNLSSSGVVYSKTWDSWPEYFKQYFLPDDVHPASASASVASRLVPQSLSNDTAHALVEALMELQYTSGIDLWIMLVTPKKHLDSAPYSLHPAWRNSTMLIRISTTWDQYYAASTPETVRPMFKKVYDAMEPLRILIPNSATSLSESDIWEPSHEEAFWGDENYKKLKEIKGKIDPEGHLVVYQGIGSEKAPRERWKCYPKQNVEIIKEQMGH